MKTLIRTNNNSGPGFVTIPSFFDDFFTRDTEFFNGRVNNSAPPVNIRENEKEFALEFAVPGMDKEDFVIELKNNELAVSAKKEEKKEEKPEGGKFICRQFVSRSFTRTFTLPEDTTDAENIIANYTNGILHVVVPKKEKTSSVKQIRIG